MVPRPVDVLLQIRQVETILGGVGTEHIPWLRIRPARLMLRSNKDMDQNQQGNQELVVLIRGLCLQGRTNQVVDGPLVD